MLIKPNNGEAAAHGCHCSGDMAVRMREVLAIRSVCLLAEFSLVFSLQPSSIA